jgi:hypothetical protein
MSFGGAAPSSPAAVPSHTDARAAPPAVRDHEENP